MDAKQLSFEFLEDDVKYVFHLKKKSFYMIRDRVKSCVYRPTTVRYESLSRLNVGNKIRLDLGYPSLKDEHRHMYVRVTRVDVVFIPEDEDLEKLYPGQSSFYKVSFSLCV